MITPTKQYIITEEQLSRIRSVIIEDATHEYELGFFEKVRSNPYHPAPEQTSLARQSERENISKIFDHTLALCDALIEKFDCQSQLGFNALLIKTDIESLREKEEEPE